MIRKTNYLWVAGMLFLALVVGCGVQEQEKEEAQETVHELENSGPSGLYLDNGSRWHVNDEMKPYVNSSEDLLKTYIDAQDTNYYTLAEKLRKLNNELIESCTMEGESHEVLHMWLHPHMALVAGLSNTTNKDSANYLIHQLKASFSKFHDYFK